MNDPSITSKVSGITLRRDEIITVWLDSADQPNERDAAQIELRVTTDGSREIFLKKETAAVIDFEDWYIPELPRHCADLLDEKKSLEREVKKLTDRNIDLQVDIDTLRIGLERLLNNERNRYELLGS